MVEAVIFDLDGTVLDNELVWEEAFVKVLTESGLKVGGELRMENGWIHEPGIGLETNWNRILRDDDEKVRQLCRLTKEEYQKIVSEGELKVMDGLVDLIEKIKEKKWLTALATSTNWHVVEDELEDLSMQLAFDVTTTAEEVMLPKPDPEIYLLTAQKLGAEPANCVVVEDAVGGVRAGAEAGMKVVGLESDYAPARMLRAAGANWVVKKLAEIEKILVEAAY